MCIWIDHDLDPSSLLQLLRSSHDRSEPLMYETIPRTFFIFTFRFLKDAPRLIHNFDEYVRPIIHTVEKSPHNDAPHSEVIKNELHTDVGHEKLKPACNIYYKLLSQLDWIFSRNM